MRIRKLNYFKIIYEDVLAERFEKTYISVTEFIDSWEKELYELNNLDYFIFLLINKLGFQIEHSFINKKNKNPYLYIEPDEIGTLAFNIGDSLESFLENNCLSSCALACPTKVDDELSDEEREYVDKNLHLVHIINDDDWNRRQFLLTDILNYVVLDSLFDFYNYDIGINLDETDFGLLQFADFIMDILYKFIRQNGHTYLNKPTEPAINLFDKLINESEKSWNEKEDYDLDDEFEETEIWKRGNYNIQKYIDEFLSNFESENKEPENEKRILEYLSNFINSFVGDTNIDEFDQLDIEEFITFWLVRELTLDTFVEVEKAFELYSKFFTWLEFSNEIYLSKVFSDLCDKHSKEVVQVIESARKYLNNSSIINGILEANSSDTVLHDGYFEIVSIAKNEFLRLQDIHTKKIYYNVRIDNDLKDNIKKANILEAMIKPTAYGWRIINIEYIFPKVSAQYLH